jgi:hypothetical protein
MPKDKKTIKDLLREMQKEQSFIAGKVEEIHRHNEACQKICLEPKTGMVERISKMETKVKWGGRAAITGFAAGIGAFFKAFFWKFL